MSARECFLGARKHFLGAKEPESLPGFQGVFCVPWISLQVPGSPSFLPGNIFWVPDSVALVSGLGIYGRVGVMGKQLF